MSRSQIHCGCGDSSMCWEFLKLPVTGVTMVTHALGARQAPHVGLTT